MNPIERIYKIQHLLQEKKIVPLQTFLDSMEVSLATFKRDLERLRDRFGAPVIYDRALNGYCYDHNHQSQDMSTSELPGLWFSEAEATALITMQQLLSSLDQGGLIGPHVEPLMTRIDSILGGENASSKELRARIKVIPFANRHAPTENFSQIGFALLKRQRLNISFYSRSSNEISQREISPQRLVNYRGIWYLDAWCHLRDSLRSFAVDGIQNINIENKTCKPVSNKILDEYLSGGYGIFAGKANQKVSLRFNPERARWVSTEIWHPEQEARFDNDGNYYLEFPYSNDTDLLLDILRHGSAVEVIAPLELRNKVAKEHLNAANLNS